MLKNTELFASCVLRFQDARSKIMDEYNREKQRLERMRGSEYYEEEIKKSAKKKDDALKELRASFRSDALTFIDFMRRANKERGMIPPTQEQASLLSVLNIRDSISKEEIFTAANSLRGCSAALAALAEIASKKAGIVLPVHLYTDDLSPGYVDGVLDGLYNGVLSFERSDATLAAQVYAEYQRNVYGRDVDLDTMAKRDGMKGEEDVFLELAGMNRAELNAFQKAVN